jgi:hypothetical protein
MKNESSFDSIATLNGDDTNINTSSFFKQFLDAYPYVSWGVDSYSQIGNAFRFQLIDQAIKFNELNIAKFNYDKLITELSFGID